MTHKNMDVNYKFNIYIYIYKKQILITKKGRRAEIMGITCFF